MGNQPIYCSVANRKLFSDYGFNLQISNDIAPGGFIQINFPAQYREYLGIPLYPQCNIRCQRFIGSVMFFFDTGLTAGSTAYLMIKNIINPDKKGGTGNFEIRSLKGSNIIDENLIFGTIGMGETPQILRSTSIVFDSSFGGVSTAGLVSRYTFNFKTVSFAPLGSYFRITLPIGLNYNAAASPACGFRPVLGVTPIGTMICTFSNNQIIVNGLGQDIVGLTVLSLWVELLNPPQTVTSPTFRLEVIRTNTQYVYDWKDGLVGPDITPGLISSVAVTPTGNSNALAMGKSEQFLLTFTIYNPISSAGMITIYTPSSFAFLDRQIFNKPTTYYVLSGLTSSSSSSNVLMQYTDATSTLSISGFTAVPAGATIKVVITETIPSQFGLSDSLIVTTYQNISDPTTVIDQNIKDFTLTVNNIPSQTDSDYSLSTNVASGSGTTTLNLRIKTTVNLNAWLIITLRGLTFSGAASCTKKVLFAGSFIYPVVPCTSTSSTVVTVDLSGSNAIAAGTMGEIVLNSMLNLPSVAQTYYIQITGATDSAATLPTFSMLRDIAFVSRPVNIMTAYAIPPEEDTDTFMFVEFSYKMTIPVARIDPTPSIPNSEIRLYFNGIGSTFMKNDLGFGVTTQTIIPCTVKSGLLPFVGMSIRCRIFPGTQPYIEVMNYQVVTPDTGIIIIIPRFHTPLGSSTASGGGINVVVRVLSSQNGVYNELSNGSYDIPAIQPDAGFVSVIPPVLPTPPTDPELTYTVDNRRVSLVFKLSFAIQNAVSLPSGTLLHLILPYYDTGFVQNPTSIVCKINEIVVSCIPFIGRDEFLITVGAALGALPSVQNYLKIEGLQWPRYIQPNDFVYLNTYNFLPASYANKTYNNYYYPTLIQPLPNYFQKFTINPDKTKQGQANVLYTLTFQTKNDIPSGASIVIDLPTQYTLLASSPAVQVLYPSFTSSATAPLTSYYSSAKVTVQNIGAYPAMTDFVIQLQGVKNPTSLDVMSSWGVSLLFNSYLIEQMTYFASFSLDEIASPNTITLNSISSFPDNALLKGDLYFSFTPRTALKEGAQITINFPSQYRLLPSNPICIISGMLTSFDTCKTNLNSISVTLNSVFLSGTINLKLKGITNPVVGETDKFIIQTSYDGQIIDIVDTSSKAGKTIFITNPPILLNINQFSYDPQNEGEVATYTFTFNPNIALTTVMQIVIKFPESFDSMLGDKVVCYPRQNLLGNIKCAIADKTITVTGFIPVTVTDISPIILEVRGIVNPNSIVNGDAGTIGLGIMYTGSTSFISFVPEAGVVETVAAPGWTFFQALSTTNTYSRATGDYLFNFTIYSPIPNDDSGGLILIDLPNQFSPPDSPLACSSLQQSTYGSINCSIINNRVYIRGNPQPFSGHLDLKISKLLNPLDPATSSYFYIKSYDGFKKQIIERSFYNLDPYFFTYTLLGPTIIINNDAPLIIEAGTQSVDIWITLNILSNLNIIVKPNSYPGISFIPYQISIGVGENSAKIRVSVSESFSQGDYQIEWKIIKDLIPSYFSPIKPTKLTVTQKRGVMISVNPINDIPFGGTSLPCMFSVVNAPDSGFQINMNMKFNYKGISLDKSIVYFGSGTNNNTFLVYFTDAKAASEENLATGQIELSITGANSAVYMLNTITLYFNIIQEDVIPPTIVSLVLNSLDQYSVSLAITTDDVVACYYMVAFCK